MRKFINLLIVFCVVIGLSACNPVVKPETIALSPEKAVAVVKINVLADAEPIQDHPLNSRCGFLFEDFNQKGVGFFSTNESKSYALIETSGNHSVNISEVLCYVNNYLYPKSRTLPIEFMTVELEPGKVNYLGDLTFDWSPESIKPADMIRIATDDHGQLVIKREDNIEAAKDFYKTYKNFQGAEWVNKKWNNHASIIQ